MDGFAFIAPIPGLSCNDLYELELFQDTEQDLFQAEFVRELWPGSGLVIDLESRPEFSDLAKDWVRALAHQALVRGLRVCAADYPESRYFPWRIALLSHWSAAEQESIRAGELALARLTEPPAELDDPWDGVPLMTDADYAELAGMTLVQWLGTQDRD